MQIKDVRVWFMIGLFGLSLVGLALLAPTGSEAGRTAGSAGVCDNSTPVQWPTNGHWYLAVCAPGRITWQAASEAATARGGYLATLTSAAENAFVYGLIDYDELWWLDYTHDDAIGPAIGGYQPPGSPEPAGNWQWVTGEPWSYTRWAVPEPNNAADDDRLLYQSRTLQRTSNWGDFPGTNPAWSTKGYIVEWDSPSPGRAEKWASSTDVIPGGVVEYTINLFWDSADGAPSDSTLSDPIPPYAEYVPGSAGSNLGSVDVSDSGRIAWSGSIPDEGVATIGYSLRIPCTGLMDKDVAAWPASIVNQATGHIGSEEYAVSASVMLLKPDLKITGLELTQVIQDLNNNMPLIKGKETYARLYVQAEYPNGLAGCDVPEVTAELRGAPGPPLAPINNSITARGVLGSARVLAGQDRPTLAERDDMRQSLFFRLPRSWYDYPANYLLTAEINPTAERPDADLANNTLDQNVVLARTREQPLYLVPIRYTVPSPPTLPSRAAAIQALQMIRMWPIAYENLDIRWLRPYELPYTLQYDVPQTMFIHSLHWMYAANSRLKSGHYLALLPGGVPTGGVNGAAFMPGKVAWVLQRPDAQATGSTVVHELSHNLDRKHVDCPPAPDPGAPSGPYAWPSNYPVCQLSDGARDGYYGFDSWDARGGYVRNPRTYADIMSYAGRRWISDFTYKGVYDKLKPAAVLGGTASMAQEDRILVSGIITPGLSTARLEYIYLSDNPHFVNDPMTGTYTLELQDAGGQVLVSDAFGVWFTDEGAGTAAQNTVLPFLRALPADPLAARPWGTGVRLVLKENGDVLATRSASATAPTVTWVTPNGGEVLSGTVDLAWTGHDDDGDPLTYIVQYSADGGATWEPVGLHLAGTQTTVDMGEFPGGDQCLFRVVASDGFYTAIDQADGFSTAARQDPTALILFPEEGQSYPPHQPLAFQGVAYDQDLVDLPNTSLAWTSDRDGSLGTGPALEATLSMGWHTVTLTATDGQGLIATEQVTFYVGYRVHLPLLLRQSR